MSQAGGFYFIFKLEVNFWLVEIYYSDAKGRGSGGGAEE